MVKWLCALYSFINLSNVGLSSCSNYYNNFLTDNPDYNSADYSFSIVVIFVNVVINFSTPRSAQYFYQGV